MRPRGARGGARGGTRRGRGDRAERARHVARRQRRHGRGRRAPARVARDRRRSTGSRWRRAAPGSTSPRSSISSGRTEEGLAVARQGLEAGLTQPWRTADWLRLVVLRVQLPPGRLGRGRDGDPGAPAAGTPAARFLYWQMSRAELALGRGDLELADEALAALGEAAETSREPQFVGPYGVMRAELLRRRGDLDAARAAVDDALDRIEYCSEDIVRIAALAVAGLRIEGDAGELARDRRDDEAAAARPQRAPTRSRARPPGGGGRLGRGGGAARDRRGRVRARDRHAATTAGLWARGRRALGRRPAPVPGRLLPAGARRRRSWPRATATAPRAPRRSP